MLWSRLQYPYAFLTSGFLIFAKAAPVGKSNQMVTMSGPTATNSRERETAQAAEYIRVRDEVMAKIWGTA